MKFLLPVILCLEFLFLVCQGRPDGAPQSACSTLMPVHKGATPRRDFAPYTLSAVKSGNKVKVTLSDPADEFQGFVIQARSARDRSIIVDGAFTHDNGLSQLVDCSGKKYVSILQWNTITHVEPTAKKQIITEWTPAAGVNTEVVFRATVAKTYFVFWTEIDSVVLRVTGEEKSESSNGQSESSNSQSNNLPTVYDNCFQTKGCFGLPQDCVRDKNCDVFLTYAYKDDGVAFQLRGQLSEGFYMAMGLSTDKLMGDDSVTECLMLNGKLIVRESFNNRRSNDPIRDVPEGMFEAKSVNGMASCSWTKENKTEVRGHVFDLVKNSYYLLVAKGPVRNERITKHSARIQTQEEVDLTAFQYIEGEGTSDSVKFHGTFMITAWIGLVSLGILLARHFKASWENHTILGVKVWFAFHRGLMITALLFVVIAFIIIFVHKNGWDNETGNPHAILGCIATALGLCQPIMSAFRPSPDHPKRVFFNWLHWSVGNTAQIIAVITMFFAVSLEASGLKESFYWVLSIFVIVHCLFHLLFQLHAWTTEKKKNNDVKMVEMSSGRGQSNAHSNNIHDKNISGSVFRILLLGIYGIFLAVIIMALYSLIGVA